MAFKTHPHIKRINNIRGWKQTPFSNKIILYKHKIQLFLKIRLFITSYLFLYYIKTSRFELREMTNIFKIISLDLTKKIRSVKRKKKFLKRDKKVGYYTNKLIIKKKSLALSMLYKNTQLLKQLSIWKKQVIYKKLYTKLWLTKPRIATWLNFLLMHEKYRKINRNIAKHKHINNIWKNYKLSKKKQSIKQRYQSDPIKNKNIVYFTLLYKISWLKKNCFQEKKNLLILENILKKTKNKNITIKNVLLITNHLKKRIQLLNQALLQTKKLQKKLTQKLKKSFFGNKYNNYYKKKIRVHPKMKLFFYAIKQWTQIRVIFQRLLFSQRNNATTFVHSYVKSNLFRKSNRYNLIFRKRSHFSGTLLKFIYRMLNILKIFYIFSITKPALYKKVILWQKRQELIKIYTSTINGHYNKALVMPEITQKPQNRISKGYIPLKFFKRIKRSKKKYRLVLHKIFYYNLRRPLLTRAKNKYIKQLTSFKNVRFHQKQKKYQPFKNRINISLNKKTNKFKNLTKKIYKKYYNIKKKQKKSLNRTSRYSLHIRQIVKKKSKLKKKSPKKKKHTNNFFYRQNSRILYKNSQNILIEFKIKYHLQDIITQYFNMKCLIKINNPISQFKNIKIWRIKSKTKLLSIRNSKIITKSKTYFCNFWKRNILLKKNKKKNIRYYVLNPWTYQNINITNNRFRIFPPKNFTKTLKTKRPYITNKKKINFNQQLTLLLHDRNNTVIKKNLATFLLLNKYLDPQLLTSDIADSFEKTKNHWPTIYTFINALKAFSFSRAISYQITISGRVNSATKTKVITIKKNTMSQQKTSQRINFSISQAKAKIGSFGIKMWLQY